MALNADKVFSEIKRKWPKLNPRIEEDGSITLCGECDVEDKDGFLLFNFYAEDPEERRYIFGVSKEFISYLDRAEWWFDWLDAGTISIYPE